MLAHSPTDDELGSARSYSRFGRPTAGREDGDPGRTIRDRDWSAVGDGAQTNSRHKRLAVSAVVRSPAMTSCSPRSNRCRCCGGSARPTCGGLRRRPQHQAVASSIAWIEKHAAFTQTGRDGVSQVDTTGLVCARITRRHLTRCQELNTQINALEKELRMLVRRLAPSLLEIPGCGVLSAAVIVGETAGVHRFRNKDAYARFTGTAPVPVWSGSSKGKVRLNRGGNRSVNCALHMIAETQARGVGPGRAYLDKQTERGKDKFAALRLRRRRLSDVVFTALRADHHASNVAARESLPRAA